MGMNLGHATKDQPPNYPWGWKCGKCGRPHVFREENGDYQCEKCDHVQGWFWRLWNIWL